MSIYRNIKSRKWRTVSGTIKWPLSLSYPAASRLDLLNIENPYYTFIKLSLEFEFSSFTSTSLSPVPVHSLAGVVRVLYSYTSHHHSTSQKEILKETYPYFFPFKFYIQCLRDIAREFNIFPIPDFIGI